MAKKKISAEFKTINKDLFEKLVLVTNENIKYFFEDLNTIFIIINIEKLANKDEFIYKIENQFHPRVMYVKNNSYPSNYIYENEIKRTNFNVYTSETKEDYTNLMSDIKTMIKGYIKDKKLYAIIIK